MLQEVFVFTQYDYVIIGDEICLKKSHQYLLAARWTQSLNEVDGYREITKQSFYTNEDQLYVYQNTRSIYGFDDFNDFSVKNVCQALKLIANNGRSGQRTLIERQFTNE